MFHDILKTQLILKGVISPEDWDDMKEHIQYDFLFDNHFNELKEQELMMQRINLATQMDPFVGKYFSIEYIRKQVLQQNEKEYKEIQKQMDGEIDSGLAMNPADINTFDMMDRQNQAFAPEIQDMQADAAHEREQEKADDAHKKQLQMAKAQPKPSTKLNKEIIMENNMDQANPEAEEVNIVSAIADNDRSKQLMLSKICYMQKHLKLCLLTNRVLPRPTLMNQ